MALITRQGKGSKLTIQEMDGNLTHLERVGKGIASTDPREYILNKLELTENPKVAGNNMVGAYNPLTRGEFIINNTELLVPENTIYVLSSVETYLKFQEAIAYNDSALLANQKINIGCSVETYLKFHEAWLGYSSTATYNFNPQTGFVDEFLAVLNDETYFKPEEIARKKSFYIRLMQFLGIVELGQIGPASKLVYSHIIKKLKMDIEARLFLAESSTTPVFPYGNTPGLSIVGGLDNDPMLRILFEMILFNGIVVREYKGNLIISTVEEYLKFSEAKVYYVDDSVNETPPAA